MVGAISNSTTSSISTVTPSSSGSGSQLAALKAQLAAKQAELDQATTDDEKATLNSAITALKAQIAAAQSADKQSGQQAAKSNDNSGQPRWQESRPPEGNVSSQVMNVLMQLSQGGMMPPDGGMQGAERPSASELYADMDADGDGSVTKDEFIAGRPEHASEEEATAFYNSIDTEGTGSITEEQFAESMEERQDAGRPPMGPPGGMGPTDGDLQQLLAALGASTESDAVAA